MCQKKKKTLVRHFTQCSMKHFITYENEDNKIEVINYYFSSCILFI